MENQIPVLIPLAEAARMLNVPPARLQRAMDTQTIRPDFRAGRSLLFHPETLERVGGLRMRRLMNSGEADSIPTLPLT